MRTSWLTLASLFYFSLSMGVFGQDGVPRIIAPDAILRDQAASISVAGLKPGNLYAIRTEFLGGTAQSISKAQFEAWSEIVIFLNSLEH